MTTATTAIVYALGVGSGIGLTLLWLLSRKI